MVDLSNSIRVRAHQANIERYRKLLAGRLTRVEREYVMRRIAEERAALRQLEGGEDDTAERPSAVPNVLAEREAHAATLPWEQRL